ncbi:MAG: hypothetical protein ACRC4M_00730 [Mycoplasma sp.]
MSEKKVIKSYKQVRDGNNAGPGNLWAHAEPIQSKGKFKTEDLIIKNRFDFGNEDTDIVRSVKPYNKDSLFGLFGFKKTKEKYEPGT